MLILLAKKIVTENIFPSLTVHMLNDIILTAVCLRSYDLNWHFY